MTMIEISTTTRLSEKDLTTITNGLSVAADQFDEYVTVFGDVGKALRAGQKVPMWADGEAGARGADGIAQQFTKQAEDSRRLRELLEQASDVVVTTEPYEEEVL